MKVSIITPCYNAAPYIAATISSVQQQTLSDWEMIIVDDGATNARIMPTCAPKKNISTKCKTGGKTLTSLHWRASQACTKPIIHRKMVHNPL